MARVSLNHRWRHPLQALLRTKLHLSRDRRAGFTLLELLVSILIGALITVSLLTLTVQLTQTNLIDTARSEVQRDMQAASDYIAQDLREAVFVYDAVCLSNGLGNASVITGFSESCPRLRDWMPALNANQVPMLAFWRPDPLPPTVDNACRTAAPATLQSLVTSGVPCISSYTYSLIVYVVDRNRGGLWQGNSRIVRYKYGFPDTTAAATIAANYVDPIQSTTASFLQWPYIKRVNTTTNAEEVTTPPAGVRNNWISQTLVDFVDATPVAQNNVCPDPAGTYATYNDQMRVMRVSSSGDAGNVPRGFYGCVRGNLIDVNPSNTGTNLPSRNEQRSNQEVLVVLAGSVTGRPGFPRNFGGDTRLSPIQTRVLTRGALGRGEE